jgi:Fe-S oxidoreductase
MEIFKKLKKYSWMLPIFKNASKEDRANFVEGYKHRKTYYTMDNIDANIEDLARCALCPNMCRFDCPAVQVTKKEPYAPAQKARIGYFMAMDYLPMSNSSAIDTLYQCMGCDACYQWCPMDISTGDLLFEMRAELEKRDLIPEHLHPLKIKIEANGSIFEHSPFTEDSDFNHNDPNPEVFYYIGCMDAKYQPTTIHATMAILEHLGIKYCTHFEARQCCGGPVRKAGYNSVAKGLSQQNRDLIEGSKVKLVISNCPGCTETLLTTYKSLGNPIRTRVVHVIDFLLEKLQNKQLVPTVALDKTITYHDPCVLSRRDNILNRVEEARQVLHFIPGMVLHEPILHGDETRCCGMGGAYAVSNPEFAQTLRVERLTQLKASSPEGVDLIVSACPTCEYAFHKAQVETKSFQKRNVKDIAELLADSLGLSY